MAGNAPPLPTPKAHHTCRSLVRHIWNPDSHQDPKLFSPWEVLPPRLPDQITSCHFRSANGSQPKPPDFDQPHVGATALRDKLTRAQMITPRAHRTHTYRCAHTRTDKQAHRNHPCTLGLRPSATHCRISPGTEMRQQRLTWGNL